MDGYYRKDGRAMRGITAKNLRYAYNEMTRAKQVVVSWRQFKRGYMSSQNSELYLMIGKLSRTKKMSGVTV